MTIIHRITKEGIASKLLEHEAYWGMSTDEFLALYEIGIPPEMDVDAFDWKTLADWNK